MANTKREKLFAEFPPVPTEKWEEVIAVDLKGADYERKLVWRTPEGFNVRPYYRAENLEGLKFLASEPGEFPYVRGTRCDNVWRVHQSLTVKCPEAANAEALKLLDSGVDSLGFSFTKGLSAAEVETLLRDIHLPAVEVVFSGEGVADVVEPVLAKIEKEGWQETASVHFVLDPIINRLSLTGAFCSPGGEKCFKMLAGLVRRTAAMKGVRVVTVSGENFSNAGSTIVEELAFTLSAGHEYLVRLMDEGLTVDEAARKIRFSMGVTSNYFMEMAKFRAARMLWANIVKGYNPEKGCSCKLFAQDRSGKTPKAFMLTAGHLAMARARAQFSCNFFACAGIRVQDNTFFKDLEEGVKAALESKAEIVVLCSSDDCYAELAPRVKEMLGDKAILVIAGAPACMAELEAQGIGNFIHVKSNVLDTLHNYLTQMGI